MGLPVVYAIPRLEVCEPISSQHVAAPDSQEPEVDHVEEERQATRERGDQQDDRDEQKLEAPDHETTLSALLSDRAGGAMVGSARPVQISGGYAAAVRAFGLFHRNGVEDLGHNLARIDVVHRRTGLDDESMGQRGLSESFDVIWDDIVAAGQRGKRLSGAIQSQRATGRRAEVDVRVSPGGVDDSDYVVGHARVHIDLAHGSLQASQFVHGQDLLEVIQRVGELLLVENQLLVCRAGIPEANPQHEPIELGFRQGECALVLDRVLRRDDEERLGHEVGRAVDRGLVLFHAFEQRRLRLGRCPVDLVGQHHLGHDRAGPELELLRLLVVYRKPGYVGWEQIRRELDPPEAAPEAPGDRFGKHCLAGAGNVLYKKMAATEQSNEGQPYLLALADDYPFDVRCYLLAGLLDRGHDSHFRTRAGWWPSIVSQSPSQVSSNRPAGTGGRSPSCRNGRTVAVLPEREDGRRPAGTGGRPAHSTLGRLGSS